MQFSMRAFFKMILTSCSSEFRISYAWKKILGPFFHFSFTGKGGTLVLQWTHEGQRTAFRRHCSPSRIQFHEWTSSNQPWWEALLAADPSLWPPRILSWDSEMITSKRFKYMGLFQFFPFCYSLDRHHGKTAMLESVDPAAAHTRFCMPAESVEETRPHGHRQCTLSSKEAEIFNWKSYGKDSDSDDQRLKSTAYPCFISATATGAQSPGVERGKACC